LRETSCAAKLEERSFLNTTTRSPIKLLGWKLTIGAIGVRVGRNIELTTHTECVIMVL